MQLPILPPGKLNEAIDRPLGKLNEAIDRPLGKLNEAIDRPLGKLNSLNEVLARDAMLRASWPFSWVAPRACATSARLTARCGGVWRAMAMSLPQGIHTWRLVGRMLNRATF